MKKLLWIFFIGICFAQSGQNFLKKTEVGDSINAHLTNYADKPEMMDSILANAGTASGLPDTALTLRQVIIDSSSAIRADMGNASVNYIDSVANLKLDKTALKDSINARNLVYETELDDSISSVRQVIIDSTASVNQNIADSMNTIMMLSEVIDSMKAAIADTLKSTYIVPSNVNGNLSISASTSLNMTSVDIKVFGNIEFNNTVSFFDTLEIPFGIKLGSFPSTDGIIKNTMSNRVSKFYGGSLTNSGAMFLYGQSHSTKPKFIELLTGNTVRQSISGTGIVSFTSDTVKNSGVFRNTGFVNSVAGYLFNGTNINTKNTLTNVAYKDSTNTFTQTQKATVFNATSALQLNGTSINTTGTLTNVAYKGQDNGFTTSQTITGDVRLANASTGRSLAGTDNTGRIIIGGGSGGGAANGASIYLTGNTYASNPGRLTLLAGQQSETGKGDIIFRTGSSSQNYMVINHLGNVGIGATTDATEKLDVTGNIRASGTGNFGNTITQNLLGTVGYGLVTSFSGTYQNAFVSHIAKDASNNQVWRANWNRNSANTSYFLQFLNASDAFYWNALAFDYTNKRVGINNTSPSEALDVTGNIKASGNINAVTAIQLNGADINDTGTLTNVAYKGQNNNFTVSQTISEDISTVSRLTIRNTNTGTGAFADVTIFASNGSGGYNSGSLGYYSSVFSSSLYANYLRLSTGANSLGILIDAANTTDGRIRFKTGSTEKWRVANNGNLSNDGADGDEALDVTGNIKASGDITYDISYGELSTSTADTTICVSGGRYYKLDSIDDGDFNNVTLSGANGTITVDKAGVYKVSCSSSFTHSVNNTIVHFSLFVNTTEDTQTEAERKIGTAGDLGSASFTGIVSLAANDVLTVRYNCDNAGTVTTNHFNFNIFKIK